MSWMPLPRGRAIDQLPHTESRLSPAEGGRAPIADRSSCRYHRAKYYSPSLLQIALKSSAIGATRACRGFPFDGVFLLLNRSTENVPKSNIAPKRFAFRRPCHGSPSAL